ncbi:MAG: DUF4214 domain-containing protein, partial [Bryobacteraceae bacterium]
LILSNTAFVNLLYPNVLDRDPDAGGLKLLDRPVGCSTRGEIMYSFAVSAEFAARIRNRALATLLYMDSCVGRPSRLGRSKC